MHFFLMQNMEYDCEFDKKKVECCGAGTYSESKLIIFHEGEQSLCSDAVTHFDSGSNLCQEWIHSVITTAKRSLNWIEVKNVKFHWNTWKTWTVVWDCHVFFLLLTWQSWAGSILRHYSWRAAVNETEETLTFDFRWHLALSFGLLEDISKCQGLSGVAHIIPFISTNKIW